MQRVRLAVYDLLGCEVARLVESVRPAGTHWFTFAGTHLAADTYLVRLKPNQACRFRR